ncbi:MAG: exosortase-associated EpsI family protein, partial [Deltaproteobacteria bacterium]|nr:exosortase-associated EpsI family protein [Deltaproteobacteria bacterium]
IQQKILLIFVQLIYLPFLSNFTSEYAAKFYMVWDGLWRRRTDGALVRLITSLRTVGKSRCASPLFFIWYKTRSLLWFYFQSSSNLFYPDLR